MNIIIVIFDNGCQCVAFDYGYIEYLGKKYRLVSPYTDNRTKHWLDDKTKIIPISHYSKPLLF